VEGQEGNDIFNSVGGELGLFWEVNRFHEEFQELLKGWVVHPVDKRDFDHCEVDGGTSNSDRSILFTLLIDFLCLDFGVGKLSSDFLSLCLGVIQDVHEFGIIEEITLWVNKSFQEILIESLEIFLVLIDVSE
jgi:hypothetical protein